MDCQLPPVEPIRMFNPQKNVIMTFAEEKL